MQLLYFKQVLISHVKVLPSILLMEGLDQHLEGGKLKDFFSSSVW